MKICSPQEEAKAEGSEAAFIVERKKIHRTTTRRLYKLLPIRLSLLLMIFGTMFQLKIPAAYGLGVVHVHHQARRFSMRCSTRHALTSLPHAATHATTTTTTANSASTLQQQRRGFHPSSGERCRGHSRRWATSSIASEPGMTSSSLPKRVHESLSRVILPIVLKQHHAAAATADSENLSPIDETTTAPAVTAILLVLVSGGCDSVGLLHALMAARKAEQEAQVVSWETDTNEEDNDNAGTTATANIHRVTATALVSYQIHVVHFDHEQRGAASDGDRELVRDLCRHYDLPLDCYYWKDHNGNDDGVNDKEHEHDKAENFSQDVARQWRRRVSHELVQRLCREASMTATVSTTCENGDDSDQASVVTKIAPTKSVSAPPNPTDTVGIILTAHHQDDSNETLLLKVLRGAHLTNLRGMDVVVRVQHHIDSDSDSDDTIDDSPMDSGTADKGGPLLNLNPKHSHSYWARPLLTTTKAEIVDYLESNSQAWRTDASNATPKYRRNRIRNELLPLLQEVVGGQDALQRRLDHLVEQSQELHADLTSRAEAYLDQGGNVSASSNLFLLPSSKTLQDVVHKQALYLWVQERSEHQFAYEHLQRACAQLKDHPNRLQWRLNIGEGWDIVREGETLRLVAAHDEPKGISFQYRRVDWLLANTADDSNTTKTQDTSQQTTLQISLPREHVSGATQFHVSTVEETKDLRITPPWRKGRSPMKVSEFLRGQKVALHERKQAHVVCMERDGEPIALVSAYVATKTKWILDAKFDCEQDPTNRVLICIKLE